MISIAIIGAGASGLFCASLLAQRGFHVTVLDNGKKVGRKILMSGGGHCNFTNLNLSPQAYLSQNPHFCKSALSRFTQWDFIQLVEKYKIQYYKKTLGQLFCTESAQQITDLLKKECDAYQVQFILRTEIIDVEKRDDQFKLITSTDEDLLFDRVVVASGGLSMPQLGTTPIGYKIAEKFNIPVIPVRAGLVPLTLTDKLKEQLSSLAGISLPVEVSVDDVAHFKESLLFTHRGLSGPVILQISSYWQTGASLTINLLPEHSLESILVNAQQEQPKIHLKTLLAHLLPKRLVEILLELNQIENRPINQYHSNQIHSIDHLIHQWKITPNGTEGYRTAEVTIGGVDTNYLSSKTMEAKNCPHLYFIGEVVDVTGWLGGYNFQWAWSSAYACATEMS